MSKLEQFLKPPTNINSEEEMYNESQEREEELEVDITQSMHKTKKSSYKNMKT